MAKKKPSKKKPAKKRVRKHPKWSPAKLAAYKKEKAALKAKYNKK